MSDTSWVLKGVDPETRGRAVEEAERLGMSLADYVTDRVLQSALHEQMAAVAVEAPAASAEPSDFGVRHRFRTLERRLESSVSSLDGALHALDSALFDVASRVGELEGLAGDTAHSLQQNLQEMAAQLAAVRLHITDVEENAVARDDEAAAAHAGLSHAVTGLSYRAEDTAHRAEAIEAIARRADTNAAVLADAHESLKHAVADDFAAFAQDVSQRLHHGLRDVAVAADEAAAQADAAVAHLVVELRGVRESLEQSVADGVDETRRRMHAAFSDASERIEALGDRVDHVEMISLRANEQLRIRITDLEDAAQTSLEETADSLRQAGAALAADLHRHVQDGRAALESVHGDLASEIGDLRERQHSGLARLKQVDAAVRAVNADITTLREQMLRRISESEGENSERLAHAQGVVDEHIAIMAARLDGQQRDAAETSFNLRAETERVEVCTLAALDKLARDIAQGDAANASFIDDVRRDTEASLGELREQQAGAAARLKVIDLAIGTQSALAERVSQLEAATPGSAAEQELSALQAQVSVLAQTLTDRTDKQLAQHVEALRARLAAYENHASQAADGVDDLVRMIGRATAQQAEAATKSEERLVSLEAKGEELVSVQRRLGQMEMRQLEALQGLRADIVRFVNDNDRRLGALETPEVGYNLAAEFDALRRRVEERILGVEQRSVRTLEQVADTVAMLEQRLTARPEGERQSA